MISKLRKLPSAITGSVKSRVKATCCKRKGFLPVLQTVLIIAGISIGWQARSQSFPEGFTRVQVTTGLSNPTTMAFAPDGRIFLAQQNGTIKIIKNGSLLTTPFMKLSVQSTGERGLVGITLDPNFSTNQYVYLYYTLPDGSRNRVSRFTGNGDVVASGSEMVLLNLDSLSTATIHNGGAMHFGADGKLYIAVGDNSNSNNAQNLETYMGKLLRINSNGTVPSGNPFSGSAHKSRIWAYGLRNPYTFSVQPGTGRLLVNDVGQDSWEEINDATTGGKNFGWPLAEGNSTNSSFTNPVYVYPHGTGDGKGCAITGGAFFNPATTNYPSSYWGKYFFQDYCNQWINTLDLSGASASGLSFATGLGNNGLVIDVGKDGNLYYIQRSTGALYKIIYTNNTTPAIVQQPASVTVSAGQPATFSVTATGSAPLKYQWQKNSTNITGATSNTYTIASTQSSDAASYKVVVSNSIGSVTSNSATLTVTSFNTAPVAKIITPAENTLYKGGDTIQFSGSATDKEDGTLPASAFSWSVDFHHDTHIHDGPPVTQGSKTGYFVIPTTGEVSANVWYRLIVVVADSKGLKDSVYRDIYPEKSTLTFTTQPAGLQIALDGQPITTTKSVAGVVGIQRTIGAIAPQASGFKIYNFDRWRQGGAATQTISTPENDSTFTAIYKESPFSSSKLEAEKAKLYGAVVETNHSGYTGNGFADYVNASSDYIEWTVNAATTGNYTISFRYALAADPRKLQIQVNGTTINTGLSFPTTSSWSSWSTIEITARLVTGSNKIRAVATGTSGPNMDYIIVTPQTLQAEDALIAGAMIATNHDGFAGTGFVDYSNSTGDYIEWMVYKSMAESVSLDFRYANGSTANRPLALQVNGTTVTSNLGFSPTGGWNTWGHTTFTTNLPAGISKIRLQAIGYSGANIDQLSWNPTTTSGTSAIKMNGGNDYAMDQGSKDLTVMASPNPASGIVRLQINKSSDLPVKIVVTDAVGRVYKNLSMQNSGTIYFDLSLKDFTPGVYMINVQQGDKKANTKLVVQHY